MKAMVFIDYQNFSINLNKHYNGIPHKTINYVRLGRVINEILPFNATVMKTYLFAYKPCTELMKLEKYQIYYQWLTNLKKVPYLEIIEGRQEIRFYNGIEFNIEDPYSYYTEEKETDINLANHLLTKAFQNAYDIAIIVTGDTDYINVVETLHSLGKVVIIAHFPHQNISKYDGICDTNIILYDDILNKAANKIKRK